jgi:DNA-directed RNA polymerase delta subunit
MKLDKMTKEELELMPYTELAALYLKEHGKTMNTADLFKAICNLLELPESVYVDKIADFFASLTTNKDFILLEDGTWDLKSNHSVKLNMDDIYEEKEDLEEESSDNEDEVEDAEEPDDIDSLDDDNYIDDDDDDLSDLTIVNDDELEE